MGRWYGVVRIDFIAVTITKKVQDAWQYQGDHGREVYRTPSNAKEIVMTMGTYHGAILTAHKMTIYTTTAPI
jgi:hypothetical protein